MHRRHTFLERVSRTALGCDSLNIFAILPAQAAWCSRKRLNYWHMVWPEGSDAKDRVGRPMRGRKSGGSTCRCTPQTAHNVPREGTSKIVYPSSRQLRRPAAPESGGSITVWYGTMGTMPFNRSRGRLAAGKASDRSGVVVSLTTTSRVLGGWILRYRVGAGDLLLKRAAVLSPDGTGRWAQCRRSGRQTD